MASWRHSRLNDSDGEDGDGVNIHPLLTEVLVPGLAFLPYTGDGGGPGYAERPSPPLYSSPILPPQKETETASFYFYFARKKHKLLEKNPAEAGNKIMSANTGRSAAFNDLPLFQSLRLAPSCMRVDLSEVRCLLGLQENSFLGVQSIYRSTFSDGTTQEHLGPQHLFNSSHTDTMHIHQDAIVIEKGEFLVDIFTREGEITDAVQFITNRRRVNFGLFGRGQGSEQWIRDGHLRTRTENSYSGLIENRFPVAGATAARGISCTQHAVPYPHATHRIVALAGSSSGKFQRIGYYTNKVGWAIIGPLVMLRWLIERDRAHYSIPIEQCSQHDLALRRLMSGSEDIFRNVLSFLIS